MTLLYRYELNIMTNELTKIAQETYIDQYGTIFVIDVGLPIPPNLTPYDLPEYPND